MKLSRCSVRRESAVFLTSLPRKAYIITKNQICYLMKNAEAQNDMEILYWIGIFSDNF